MRSVAILGCGYVGLELGRRLPGEVVGVRRSDEGVAAMEAAGLEPVRGDLREEETLSAVPDVDVVVFAASAGRGDAREVYVDVQRRALSQFAGRANPPDRYLYTSSTGVYGDHGGEWVDEETPLEPATGRAEALVEAETVALEGARERGIDGTVVRFAGLYGPGRYRLERYLDGPVTEGVLNLVHRDDAAGALAFFVDEGCARDEVVLVCDDEPVEKWTLADWLAERCGEPGPPKRTKAERLADETLSQAARRRIRTDKRCRNDRLRALGYDLQYPTFREGYRPVVESYRESRG